MPDVAEVPDVAEEVESSWLECTVAKKTHHHSTVYSECAFLLAVATANKNMKVTDWQCMDNFKVTDRRRTVHEWYHIDAALQQAR